jgi:hypothetical protein
MTTAGFKSTIPASERPQTHSLDLVATKIGAYSYLKLEVSCHITTCDCVVILCVLILQNISGISKVACSKRQIKEMS